ncbi:MAG: hypothetical protein IJC25_00830, partial [Clostridia bacterium]|nr:hypothetical protein [Clostridia bacterium]
DLHNGWGFCDDFASLVTPSLWPQFVLPAFHKFFDELCGNGERFLHVENLTPAHLPYMNQSGLRHYQPSVSDQITIADIKQHMDPSFTFDQLLYAYHIVNMSDEEIQKWVDYVVSEGVSKVRTQVGTITFVMNKTDRIKAFLRCFDKYRV